MTIADERHRWSRVKAIFDATLQQPPDTRTAFVEEACRDDSGLRADVQSLLAAHETAGSFAERPAMAVLASAVHAARPGPALEAGREIGPYRIVGPLGAGGMSEVYRALDTELHREIAIKVLPATRSGDPAWSARLQQEARVLASLSHPGIGTIHGLQRAGDVLAIVMELVEGPTLADRLRRGPLPPDEALAVARQIADALEAAHEKGVIHCDLKAANVKLTTAGDVKVLDFGLAHLVRAPAGDSAGDDAGAGGSPGGIAGTPACMSPEQVRGDRVDARTDVWAFGCLLFEMLTGHPAFGRSTIAETLTAVMEEEPDWGRLPASVPIGVRRLLRRCLARDPRRRLHHIADARLELDDAIAAPGDDAADRAAAGTRARRLAIAVAALAIACAATLGVLLVRARSSGAELRAVEITTPRTPDPWSFAISPDGRLLAFVAEREGQPMLWVRALDAAAARVLPGTEGARRPFWSPDSRSVGFFVTSEIKRIDVGGGAAHRITLALAATAAAWGPDGTILYSGTSAPELFRVGADGGTPRVVTAPAIASTGHRHPRFLPDGRRFLFFVGGPDALRGIHLGSLDGPEVTRLVASDGQGAYVAPGWLLFVRQETLWAQRLDVEQRRVTGDPLAIADGVAFEPIDGTAAFSVSGTGVLAYRTGRPTLTQFAWFDRAGRWLGAFGSPEQTGLTNPRLSPDAGRLAAERSLQNETDVWVLDAAHQLRVTRASDASATRLPVWSPDGARLVFESIRSGSVALAVKAATGDGPEDVLFASPEPKIPCDWSPDGRFLVYYVPTPQTGTDLWILPMDSRVPSVFLRTDANELWGQFSPDGRWMAYQSNETGRYEIYVRPFPSSGGPIPVSTAGGVYPRWSRDGGEIYFVAPDATLMAVKLRESAGTLAAGAPEPLFRTRRLGGGLNVIGRGPQYDVTTDGRFLVNVDTQSTATPITLLLNWTPESADAARADR